ncbi:acyltransferase family protein [Pedobacter soli]|uniref:Peptidoglycan/LPS O-acetylase OafA/YrhL, contains acyltransferase and SGNH-hydrolase domains n=1 Tax=Pedobacter soli TaxID=390242 RepID=A0A1G6X6L6_9SPHI|nr:acyltransferase [Pedobacter soli]SDD72956.1 Peptidoglycan/LPS O-acetylase OafA/YrhL, contains acyltransferase and SGNH-hydrolase domains [Pedobacter soli]
MALPGREKMNSILSKLNSSFTVPGFLEKSYFPSLDGWRAVAIIMVILGHAKSTVLNSTAYYRFFERFVYAELGVRIFFILSGFLITSLLLKEFVQNGKIVISNFFIKRALRIFPVLYLYIITICIVNSYFGLGISNSFFWGMLCYFTNFIMYNNPWLSSHTWSLSVEEQFYLIWPIIIYAIKKKAWLFSLSLIVLTQLLRVLWYKAGFYQETLGPFLNGADAIFLGSLLSIVSFKRFINPLAKYWSNQYFHFLAIFLVFFIYYSLHRGMFGKFLLPFGYILSDLAIGYLLLATIINAKGLIYNTLNNAVMVKLGVISYSLYIWQQLFIVPLNYNPEILPRAQFPFNILISIFVAFLSYYCFEKHFLNLKKRLTNRSKCQK